MRPEPELELPIPYGWYCVGYGDELPPGGLRALRYFAEDLVLFRNEAGVPGLVDAYCPHRGAHLGDGRVEGGGLRCPFHGWRFDPAGACLQAPPEVAPDAARVRTRPLLERNGFLWAWYHPHRVDPLFPVQEFEEISSGAWTDYEKHEWRVETHIQESGENAVDSAHFHAVHRVRHMLARPEVRFEGHRRVSDLAMELTRITAKRGREAGKFVDGRILTRSSGPGQTWTRQLGIADLLIIGLATPVERASIHLRFAISVPKHQEESQRALSRLIVQNAVEQVEQDIPIWEHKIYQPAPVLCDGDGPIGEYRRWFRQFYVD